MGKTFATVGSCCSKVKLSGLFFYSKVLFNANIWQNFTLEEVNLKNKKKQKKLSLKRWKYETKVYANPGLSLSAFEQPCPGACFSKVPRLFGLISGDIILFVSAKRRRVEAWNFAVVFIYVQYTRSESSCFYSQADWVRSRPELEMGAWRLISSTGSNG